MNLEDLGNLGELIAALATVATLVYLALQIRQNNESAKISAGQSILSSLNDALQMAASSPQAAKVLILGQSEFDSLQEEEKAQFITWVFAWFRVLEQGEYYHRKGYLEDDVWLGQVEHLKQVIQSPPVANWWSRRNGFFNTEFRRVVSEAAEAESSDPMPSGLLKTISQNISDGAP